MDLLQIQQYSHKIIKIAINNTNEKSSYNYVTIKISGKDLDRKTNEIVRFSLTKNPTASEWIEHQSSANATKYDEDEDNTYVNNSDDYFLRIPNITPSVTEIYAHFFPASLYDYDENEQIFSIYDFSDFIKDTTYNKWDNMEYPLQITSYGYEMLLGYDNKPLIRSLLKNSVTRYKDPNYKNYIQTDITKEISDMTEKGRFPLSSRYRDSLYRTAPILTDKDNFKLPYWKANNIQYSHGATPKALTSDDIKNGYEYEDNNINSEYSCKYCSGDKCDNCKKRQTQIPFWEAKIYRSGLSPLINNSSGDEYTPINVYLNYQYLPTSTEYHQHYFGFEEQNIRQEDGEKVEGMISAVESYKPNTTSNYMEYDEATTEALREQLHEYTTKIRDGTYRQITSNKDYEVLDGEGLIDINTSFGDEDKTYRIIRHGNPFDNENSIYVDHKNIFNVNLDAVKITKNCLWEKNQCSKNHKYWSYIPQGKGYAALNVTLKANTPYVLKYFMYIPADAYVEDDSCYMQIESNIDGNTELIGSLDDIFKAQDKKLRHQWIYHEIPFYTYETNNRIVIVGPQHKQEGIIGINRNTQEIISELTENDYNNPNIDIHNCKNDIIHFYSIQIAEMVEYSPTLKYTKTGVYVVEGDKYAHKPLEDNDDTCTEDNNIYTQWSDKGALIATNMWINKGTTQLPIPATDIYIFFDGDFNIIYNQLTSELSYTKGDAPFTFNNFNEIFDETLLWTSNDSLTRLDYDKQTTPIAQATNDQLSTNRTSNDINLNNLFIGELKLFAKQNKTFTTGVNNEFALRIQDAYSNPISTGEIECSIWTSDKEDTTPCLESEKCLGVQTPNEYGIVKYKNLNFKTFDPNRNNYYLRVVYKNSCYKKDIIKWKKLIFVEERRNITIYTNKCSKKICLDNTSTCCNEVATSIFDDNENDYIKTCQLYSITSVEEFPLRLDVKIRDQLGNIKNDGYCELSINDNVTQSTFVDDNGIADFYLDEYDLENGIQTIKIEHFTKPNENINFAYFIINCDNEHGYDERPAIPISINQINGQLINGIYSIPKDDILFIDIDTKDHKDFSITIQRNNEEEVINIIDTMKHSYTIAAMYKSNNTDRYIITTGNLKNEDGNDINSEYRTSKKEFTVAWQ